MKPLPPGMTLRPLTASDLAAAHELRKLAGWNQSERDWAGYLEFEPAGCLAAEVAGRVIGTATTITYGTRMGWIGMVLVHPSQRREGVGTALLNASIRYLKSRGVEAIKLDATPMGREIYERLGFCDEYELARHEGIAPPADSRRSDAVCPLTSDVMEELISFDAPIFGAPRPAVLASLCRRNPGLCFVWRGPTGLAGYLIAREGSNAVQVGPWMARDGQVAEQLLGALLQRVAGRRVFIDVPAPNRAGRELMVRIGFTVQRGLTRMFLGSNNWPGTPALVFSTSGAEKG
jgi:GNAT superfamily N-acetyltransferase